MGCATVIEQYATTPSGRPIVANLTRDFPASAYGVIGDGARDDWGPLNEALAAAGGQGGGRVLLPSGCVVMVGRRVTMPAGVELFVPWSTTLRLMAGVNLDVIGLDGGGCAVRGGGTVDGNRANQTGGLAFGISVSAQNCLLEDVRVIGTRGPGVAINNTQGCELRGLTIEDVGVHGVQVLNSDRCLIQGIVVRDVGRVMSPGLGDGVQLQGTASYNVISGVTLSDSAGAAGTSGYAVRELNDGQAKDWNCLAAIAAGPGCIWSHQVYGLHSGFQSGLGQLSSTGVGPLNLLTNGGHEIWQRGVGPFTANGAYSSDRWQIALGGASTLSVSRAAAGAGEGSQYAAGLTYVHAASGSAYLRQTVENWRELVGRTISAQAFVKVAAAATIRLAISDGITVSRSAYNAGTAGESLNVSLAVALGATTVEVRVEMDVASVTGYVDSVTLVAGPTPAYYTPLNAAEELLRCQRYYLELGGLDALEVVAVGQAVSTTAASIVLRFPVEMAIAATMTLSAAGDWALMSSAAGFLPCTSLTVAQITRRSVRMTAVVASGLVAGNAPVLWANNNTTARMRFEANPP